MHEADAPPGLSFRSKIRERVMVDQSRKPSKDSEAELWNAIAAFEKILEALPNDRVSLETLVGAYEKIGDYARSLEFAFRLTRVLEKVNTGMFQKATDDADYPDIF